MNPSIRRDRLQPSASKQTPLTLSCQFRLMLMRSRSTAVARKDRILAIVRMELVAASAMSKITSKYQVTVPKAIADQYRLRPGDEIDWQPAGGIIRVIPAGKQSGRVDRATALRLFDQSTERHRRRRPVPRPDTLRDRGWKREDLYERGRSH